MHFVSFVLYHKIHESTTTRIRITLQPAPVEAAITIPRRGNRELAHIELAHIAWTVLHYRPLRRLRTFRRLGRGSRCLVQ
jgi:hypothetical protein